MFILIYLALIAASAVPLARTLYIRRQRRRAYEEQGDDTARLWRNSAYITAVLVAIVLLETWVFSVAADSMWFGVLGQSQRYWLALGYQLSIFAVVWIVITAFFGANLEYLWKPFSKVPRFAGFFVACIVALPLAYIATFLWMPITAYLGASPTGAVDPIFGKDTAFYMLELPLYHDVRFASVLLVIAALVVWGAIGFWYKDTLKRIFSHDERSAIWSGWIQQGLILGALFAVLAGIGRLLDRYDLVVDGNSGVVPGASYIDVNWWIPFHSIMAYAWFFVAAILIVAISGKVRAFFTVSISSSRNIPRAVAGVAAFALLYLGVPVVILITQFVYVKPNEITLEQPYVVRGIEGTRSAYNLSGPNVEEREFTVSNEQFTRENLEQHAEVLRDARIWDWRALLDQLQQTQGQRKYYHLGDIDVDRYLVGGQTRQVMISPREMDPNLLPSQARVWVNVRLKYTHGYGAVAVPVNEHDSRGNPRLWSHDIPVVAEGELEVKRHQIYFGEITDGHVYVNTTEKEFDYPHGEANVETVYEGSGGIVLSNLWRRLVFARKLDGLRVFTSSYFKPESKVLWRRNIKERARLLAPFLRFDRDPYMVAGGDHYYWILDAYTASSYYPYSDAYGGTMQEFSGINYIRNSVKVVIDGYHGSATFYVFDPNDPIIAAYRTMLPGLFKDAGEMPKHLRRHVRYPEDLFQVQAEMYGTYHMTNPVTFYNREDRWDVPTELYYNHKVNVQPYYITTQLPEATKPEFMIVLPMTVADKNQMAGWLAGLSDGENYGKLVTYTFTKGVFIDGPAQVEARISSQDEMASQLTLWDQSGSRVIRGNLLIIPVGNSLIAVEPVYVEAENTKIPQLTRVVFGQLMPNDRNIVWASTLSEAQDVLVGALSAVVSRPFNSSGEAGSEVSPATIDLVKKIFEEMQAAFSSGDFVTAGQRLEELKQVLQ